MLKLTSRKKEKAWSIKLRPIEELIVSGGFEVEDDSRGSIEYRGIVYPFRGIMVVLPNSPTETAVDFTHIKRIIEQLKAEAKRQRNKFWASLISRTFRVYVCEKATISHFDEQTQKAKKVSLDIFDYDDIKDTIEFQMTRQHRLMK
jgi:hypothetical protein